MKAHDLLDNVGTWLGHGRFDGWENSLTGFGTARDKTIYSEFMYATRLGDNTLEQLYHGDDLAQRMVDTVPEEMLRKGYCLKFGDPRDTALESDALQALTELGTNEKIIEAEIWAKVYGGALLIPVADDGFPSFQPLVPERARRIDSLEVIDRRFVWPHTYYKTGPKRGQVEVYGVGSPGPNVRAEFFVHETRAIVFRGSRTSNTERMRRNSWDVSALQRPYEVMRSFATGFKSVEILLSDGPQGVYGIKGLAKLLAGNNQALIDARLETVEKMRSALRAIAIDADGETFQRANFSFSGIPDVLDKLMLRLSASVRIPVTILMGQSPAGMNATGDSDFRWFYDRIETEQKNYLAPRLRRLIEVLLATREGPSAGKKPESIAIEFEKLWTLSPKEEAERRRTVAETDRIYFDMGAMMPEEIVLSRVNDSGQWQEGYSAVDRDLRASALDAAIEKIEAGDQTPTTIELLTPSANEAVVTVNEARAARGLGPDPDPAIGEMKVAEYRAMQEAKAAKVGEHEAAEETGEPTEAELKEKQAEAAAKNPPPGAPPNGGPPNGPQNKPPAGPAPPGSVKPGKAPAQD